MIPSRKEKYSPSDSSPANGLPSQSRVSQQLQFPTISQSKSKSPQQKQQSQPGYPWSAHAPPSRLSLSQLPQCSHTLSATTTTTTTRELFLFGGYVYSPRSPSNDLYVISTRNFSTTLLQTSGDVPSPRFGHGAALTSTSLLIWGGIDSSDQNAQNQSNGNDDSFYLLNLGASDLFDVKTRSS
jgi:hypothetical protein